MAQGVHHLLAVLGLLLTHYACVSWALDGRSRLNTILSKIAHIKHAKNTRLAMSARLHARRLPRRSHIATQSSPSFNTVLSQERRSEDNARTCHERRNSHNVPVVVEKYKLVFFTTPGVAHTEFEQLLRRMSPDTSDELTYLDAYPFETAYAVLRNDSWTKAIFFRSPVKRFVSGYTTKAKEDTDMDLSTFVDKVERGWYHPSKAYWKSQCEYVHLCDAILPFMNFVGDFGNLANDTRRLLERVGAWDTHGFDTEGGWGGSCMTFCGHEHESLSNVSNDVLHRIERLLGADMHIIPKFIGVQRRYFWCGYNFTIIWASVMFEVPVEELSPMQERSEHHDVGFVSGRCSYANRFRGLMVYIDGENNKLQVNVRDMSRLLYLGPSSRHTRIIYAATVLLYDWMNITRLMNRYQTDKVVYNLAYANGHCVNGRERVFDAFVRAFRRESIPHIHALGQCHGRSEGVYIRERFTKKKQTNIKTFGDYKFVLCMENESSPYYMTEKILNAYAAGAVPIYWGDRSLASTLFTEGSYVYVDPSNPQPAVNEVMRLLHDPDAYRAAVTKPVFKSAAAIETHLSVDLQLGSIALKNRVHRAYLHFLTAGQQLNGFKERSSPVANIKLGSGTYRLHKPTGAKAGTFQWSQEGQDRVVDKLLKAKRDGFFIEIGGYDGESLSNTLFFEMRRNWTGLLVEANPRSYGIMIGKDRRCAMVNACISRDVKSMQFKLGGALTSATGLMSASHSKRIDHDASKYARSNPGWGEVAETRCTTLNALLDQLGVNHVDYFSLDVEGAEMYILQSIDWSQVTIDVVTIEVQEHRAQIQSFMEARGYRRVIPPPVPNDDVFVRASLWVD
ncbi:methyltransferase [Pycnococcus provasolii]